MNNTSLRLALSEVEGYIHQDHLTGTAVVSSDNGTLIGSTKYYPFGDRRNSQGDLGTDKLFTGQRLDDTGLYYYNARYYDPSIGRFISADTFVPWSSGLDVVSKPLTVNVIPIEKYPRLTRQAPVNPQNLNRYSYVVNNPLRYNDPSGWWVGGIGGYGNYGAGLGTESGGMFVFDDDGNIGFLTYETPNGSGVYFGASAGGGASFFYSWNADTIYDLNGPSLVIGGSTAIPFVPFSSFGIEYVIGIGYRGITINVGGSLTPNPEAHILLAIGRVEGLNDDAKAILDNVAKAFNIMMDLFEKDIARVIEAFQSAYGTVDNPGNPGSSGGDGSSSYDPSDPYGYGDHYVY